MPRGLLGVLIFLLVSVSVARAQGDILLMKIGGEQIFKSEYEYYFNRSCSSTPQEFMEDFILYKAKTLYAKDLGLDTFPDFIAQRMYYMKTLDGLTERKDPIGGRSHHEGEEWAELWHITYPLGQHATKTDECQAKVFMDSISSVLGNNIGDDGRIGETFWIPRHFLLPEWNKALENLSEREVSKPFYSSVGLHIVGWKNKRICEGRMKTVADSEKVLVYKHRVKEIEDALLVMSLTKKQPVSCSDKELEDYFTKHRMDYRWDYPYYRGAVFHCKNKKVAKAIKKYLKQYDFYQWEEALGRIASVLSGSFKMEYGLFQIGKNNYVDKLVFKCGSFEALSEYPYTIVMGKKLKTPSSWQDVRERVKKDYLNFQGKVWNDAIKHKYEVEINEEVLKTVNNSRNK